MGTKVGKCGSYKPVRTKEETVFHKSGSMSRSNVRHTRVFTKNRRRPLTVKPPTLRGGVSQNMWANAAQKRSRDRKRFSIGVARCA